MLDGRIGSLALLAPLLTTPLLAGCGGSGATSNVTPITQAAYRTTAGPGFKISATATTEAEGKTLTLTIDGALGWPGPRGQMIVAARSRRVEEILAYPSYYVRAPGKRFDGKSWGKVNATGVLAAIGGTPASGSGSEIAEQLGFLKAAGSATRLGPDTVRGDQVTHYRVVVDLQRYPSVVPRREQAQVTRNVELVERATGQATQTLDVWVDGHDRVRRLELHEPLCTPQGRLDTTINTEIYDFGRQAVAPLPPASEVADISGRVNKALLQTLQKLHC